MQSGFTPGRFSAFTVERPSLEQFVLLSLMLHVLVIVLFGDTTGGGVRRGEKLWGALTVTVQNLLPERGGGLKSDTVKTMSREPRNETTVAPALPISTKATPVGVAVTPAPAEPERPVDERIPPSPASSFEMPPVIATDVDKPLTEFVVPKASANRAPNPATRTPESAGPEPIEPPKIEPVLATPPTPFKPIPQLATPRVDAVAVPAPVPQTPTQTTPVAEPLPAKIEREIVKPVVVAPEPKPREITQPPALVAPIAPVTPAKAEPERVQAIALPAAIAPREVPVAVQPSPTPTSAAPSAPQPAEAAKAPQIEREVVTPAAAPPTVGKPTPARTPAAAPGAASSGGDVQKPRGDAIAPTVSAPALGKSPGIDLDAVRRRAREISGGGSRTVFPFPVAPQPAPKTKIQEAFDKALKKNDCRDAYADMGLAAVVPLVLSAVREDGCRW